MRWSLLKWRGIITRVFASVLVLLAVSHFLMAQTGARGDCDLYVSVRTGDERDIEAPFQVDLLSPQGLLATVHIFGNEPAQFRVANGRTYRLTVAGRGIETITTSYFEVNPLETLHHETVHVKPSNETTAGESRPGSPTASMSEMTL